jgi:uncharacterized protein
VVYNVIEYYCRFRQKYSPKEWEVFIKRDRYLNLLIDGMHNGQVKVVTGIRRSGKSFLLFKIFFDYLISTGVKEDHIISLALDDDTNKEYRKPDVLSTYIRSKIVDKTCQYYILLDEIQYAISEEDLRNKDVPLPLYGVLNGLLHLPHVDIYVTGSNSKLLSKDVLTEFRGRGDEIHVFPLTFKEFMSVYDGDMYHAWADYYTFGGLPHIAELRNDEQKIRYLKNLFEKTYLQDVIERNRITKTQELEDLIDILASATGSLTNPARIGATFKSVLHSSISVNTIHQYIQYLEEAFLISKAKRYDVKGRRYIGTPLKYYYEDLGLRNARLGFRQNEENHIMENIIYNELRYRGYSVDIGMVEKRIVTDANKEERKQLEIDFIANLGSNRYYLQSAFEIPSSTKENQEMESLINVRDSFKKIIIVKDYIKLKRDDNGITTMSIFDFLLNEDSLNS